MPQINYFLPIPLVTTGNGLHTTGSSFTASMYPPFSNSATAFVTNSYEPFQNMPSRSQSAGRTGTILKADLRSTFAIIAPLPGVEKLDSIVD